MFRARVVPTVHAELLNKSDSMLNMCTDLLIADGWFIYRLTVAPRLHRGGPGGSNKEAMVKSTRLNW